MGRTGIPVVDDFTSNTFNAGNLANIGLAGAANQVAGLNVALGIPRGIDEGVGQVSGRNIQRRVDAETRAATLESAAEMRRLRNEEMRRLAEQDLATSRRVGTIRETARRRSVGNTTTGAAEDGSMADLLGL